MYKLICIVLMTLILSICHGQTIQCDSMLCYLNRPYVPGKIGIERKKEINQRTLLSYSPQLVDINNDCIPEIISMNYNNAKNNILIIDSRTGEILAEIATPQNFGRITNMAIADIDMDSIPDILFAVIFFHSIPFAESGRVICYNIDGSVKWISDQQYIDRELDFSWGNLGLADFNMDGIPEVYIGNVIYNAKTGKMLAEGGSNGRGYNERTTVPVAAQLDNDLSDLELAAGYSVYKVDIQNTNGSNGNIMTPNNILVNQALIDGKTSVADINQDGILDIIVHSEDENREPQLYVYTMASGNPSLIAKVTPPSNPSFRNFFVNTPTIGIIDDSKKPSILITREEQIVCYYYDGTSTLKLKWTLPTENTFAGYGLTLFDLNGDGIMEIIYRDKTYLRIINGSVNPPLDLARTLCYAVGEFSGPMVADVFGSGQANICITCADNIIGGIGRLYIFGSPDSLKPWAPARRLWNQYAYNVLNINDDLTVPQYQKNNATYENGRYNSFMAQQSLLDSNGFYQQRAASLDGLIQCINYDPRINQYTVTFDIVNRSSATLTIPSGMPVSFFNGNPQTAGTLIGIYSTTSPIAPGERLNNLSYSFSTTNLMQLFMVVNTIQTIFNPIDEKDFVHPECDYLDNFSQNTSVTQIQTKTDTICNGDIYVFGDTILTTSGIYNRVIQSNSGCDSLFISLTLEVLDTLLNIVDVVACNSFEWRGKTYTKSGFYTYQLTSITNCDSIVALNLTLHFDTDTSLYMNACDSFIWKGTTYTKSGLYVYETTNRMNCDSTIYLDLTIRDSDSISVKYTVCQSFIWHGNIYEQSGIYRFDTFNTFGCNRAIFLHLEIRDTIFISEFLSICQGDSIIVFGEYIGIDTMISKTFKTASGCDSVSVINVSTQLAYSTTDSIVLCPGDSIFIGNAWIKEEGIYMESLTSIDGCDSVISFVVTALETPKVPTAQLDCASLEITTSVEIVSPWSIKWDNGDTTAQTTYKNQSTAILILFAQPNCVHQFTIKLPVISNIDSTISISDTVLRPGNNLTINLKLNPNDWDINWSPSDVISCDTCMQVVISPTENTQITIFLTHISGCTYESSFNIQIVEERLYIPNTFTPNGDGINDHFRIFSKPGSSFVIDMSIYDRWGNLVYAQSELSPQANEYKFWDGKFNGQNVLPGVYVFVASYRDILGNIGILQGEITLIR